MNARTLQILSAILGMLLLLIGWRIIAPKIIKREDPLYAQQMQQFDREKISRIEITSPAPSDASESAKLVLTKENGKWKVNGKNAKEEKIQNLFSELTNRSSVERIAQTNARHEELKLTEEKATKIAFDDALRILIGDTTPSGVFLRFDTNDTVYLLRTTSQTLVTSDETSWQDKTIVAIAEEKIQKLTSQKEKSTVTVTHENGLWMWEEEKKELDANALRPLLTDLASLQASDLADSKKKNDYPSTPAFSLTIHQEQETETLVFFKGKTDYFVQRASDNQGFTLPEYKAKNFALVPTEMLKKTSPTPPTEK